MREIAGVTPMPLATTRRLSLSMAGDENGERNGPTTYAVLCVGLVICDMRSPVHAPAFEIQIEV